MFRARCVVILGFALPTSLWAHSEPSPLEQRVEAETLQPTPVLSYVPGPELLPVDTLRAWLDEKGAAASKPMLRLPVTVRFGGQLAFGIAQAWIGLAADPGDDTLVLRLDDGAMGESLQDRLRAICADGAPQCHVWLDGTWGPLVPLPAPLVDDRPTLAVRDVPGLVAPGEEVRVMVQE